MSTRERDGLRILWVKAGPLLPANTGGRIRTLQMLRAMSRRHHVTFLALRDPAQPDEEGSGLADYAQVREFIEWRDARRGSLRFVSGVLWNQMASSLPYVLTKYRSDELAARIRAVDEAGQHDLIVCDFLTPTLSFPASGTKTRSVIFQHNVEALIWQRMAANAGNPLARFYLRGQHRRTERWESALCNRFNGTITVSPDDSKLAVERYGLKNLLGDVPAGVDADYFANPLSPPLSPTTIGFLGSMDWLPNIEGVRWFHEHVLTELRRRCPGLRLLVIGRSPPASLTALAKDDPLIEFTGTVPDVRPFVQQCHAMIVPLLTGGGTRIKILEMMAAGRPVISTTVGAEGLGMEHGKHLLLADDASSFADECANVLKDSGLVNQLCAAALQRVQSEHSWERAAQIFVELAMR
jgi:glycosyltransferase involved in cell wall biosynthesis